MAGMLVFKVAEITYREMREQTLQILPVFSARAKSTKSPRFCRLISRRSEVLCHVEPALNNE
jgi:chorismate-pyruvate lyase